MLRSRDIAGSTIQSTEDTCRNVTSLPSPLHLLLRAEETRPAGARTDRPESPWRWNIPRAAWPPKGRCSSGVLTNARSEVANVRIP